MTYGKLFEEGRIGALRLKNRVVMPAMGTHMANASGEINDHVIEWYAARARGGVGLIITEVFAVDGVAGRSGPSNPRADSFGFTVMLQRLIDAVHAEGARIFVQLQHPGCQTTKHNNDGNDLLSPSGVRCGILPDTPRALETREIARLVGAFVTSAVNCQIAGADGIEIHGAHGYLVNQFLSPHTNKRTDDYGGTFEKRMRFLDEIVAGIRAACGPVFPIIVRLSVEEFVADGITLEEGVRMARHLEDRGVDVLNISSGIYETMGTIIEPISSEQAWRVHMAAAVKAVVKVPVIAVGVIREPAVAEAVLEKGQADLIAIGRGLIADPDWCRKAEEGRESEIRRCIGCLTCFGEIISGRRITCALNAEAGYEHQYGDVARDGIGRKAVVVGGGPGGMEAARVLAERGFRVVLFEKRAAVGGQLLFGSQPLGKGKIMWFVEYLVAELKRLGVELRVNAEADLETIRKEAPDALIVATGGDPIVPRIPGVDLDHVHTAESVLAGQVVLSGERIVVVGGGLTGCETAAWLASKGNEVSVVEMRDDLCIGVMPINRFDVLGELERQHVAIRTGQSLAGIGKGTVTLKAAATGEVEEVTATAVVLALGVRPSAGLFAAIAKHFPKAKLVGDAVAARRIAEAVGEGHRAARRV
ncbi:oxidoreductase [Oryzibacter oryziterrae]|uniref:oxidoreductase n=1 Tax=Oryzibacter oryziterrae TaxID=2766474 RepID=UPI001F23F563|nr:FAD-dependent oxidoreductase [Oryzibacter oryziterrae]